jgi:predicted ABC-type ATPase
MRGREDPVRWLESSIDVHKAVGVETVLSTEKYRSLVRKAKERSFQVWLFYVILNSPDLNVERVRIRVLNGGHAVPEDKIRARYVRSLQQFPWFLEAADRAWIYDNSGAEPKQIGEKLNGVIALDDDAIPAIRDAVEAIRTR